MPNKNAAVGDLYRVHKSAITAPDQLGKTTRPCICCDTNPVETTWSALPRVTTDIQPDDYASPPIPGIGLDKQGAWTARYIHSVFKAKTGTAECPYMGAVPKEVLIALARRYPRYVA